MSEDSSRPLDKGTHEAFAAHYAVNGNAAAAWVHATAGNADHSDANGSKWLRNSSITARVDWLKAEAERRLREEDEKQQEPVLLTIMEKRRFLRRVVMTTIGEVDETSDLCQAFEIDDKGGRKYKMPDKLKAIALDNELAPEVEAKPSEIIIRIGQ